MVELCKIDFNYQDRSRKNTCKQTLTDDKLTLIATVHFSSPRRREGIVANFSEVGLHFGWVEFPLAVV